MSTIERGGGGGGGRQTGRGCGARGVYYTCVWLSMLDVEFCNLTSRSDLEPIFDMLVRVQSTEDEYKRAKVQCVCTVCLYAEPDSGWKGCVRSWIKIGFVLCWTRPCRRFCLKWTVYEYTIRKCIFWTMYLSLGFMYLVFARMPDNSYRSRFGSLLLSSRDIFRALSWFARFCLLKPVLDRILEICENWEIKGRKKQFHDDMYWSRS